MTTELARTGASSDLVISSDQTFWTDKQKAALAQLGVANASNADLAVFFHYCARTQLDPFAKQIYMIERQGKQTIQTGIDGFRLIARRAVNATGESLGYEETLWCGSDGVWRDIWLDPQPPAAAKVVVLRDGNRYPAEALYAEYVATKRDGQPNSMWTSKPALMLAKCAEALALRKAFPQEVFGLYTSDEMRSSDAAPVAEWRTGSVAGELVESSDDAAQNNGAGPVSDADAEAVLPGDAADGRTT